MVTIAEPKAKLNSSARGGRQLKYLQLADQIQSQVESGALHPGTQLPSFAQMQADYSLSQSTLEKMYQVLEQRRLIVREPGRGVYIAEIQRARTGVIGLLANHVPESHPYYSHLLAGVREVARRENMQALLLNDIKTVTWEKLDGIVICEAYPECVTSSLPIGMPRVAILYSLDDTPSVAADDYQGMSAAVEHLMSLGHRRIGYITAAMFGRFDKLSGRRLQAYRDVLSVNKVEVEAAWLRPLRGPYEPVRKFMEMGRDRMRHWLKEDWHKLGLTALLVQNDDAAFGVIEALQEAGVSVPGDVSVVGFDGTEAIEYFRPRLTSVVVPLQEIGAAGTQLLIKQMDRPFGQSSGDTAAGANSLPTSILLPAQLKVGDSTGPAPLS